MTYSEQFLSHMSKKIYDYENSFHHIYEINCKNGHGRMSVFQIFDGVQLFYDEFDTADCFCNFRKRDNIMEISHCREGRSECKLQNGSYMYLGEGDLSVNVLCNHAERVDFPLKHYRGIDIIIFLDEFSDTISRIFPDMPIEIQSLCHKLCPDNKCFVMRAKDKVEHIFSELYTVPESIQLPYFKLKVLELLLYLKILDVTENMKQHEYYPNQQVEIIKQIHDKIITQLEKRYTIEELSKEYGINRTALKSCFKGVYGTSIGMYMKVLRMQYAAVLLTNTNQSISNIAFSVGYENQSRFGITFKEVIGTSPLKYRKNNCPIRTKPV